MKVRELMVRDVKTCLPENDLNRAAQIMWEADCGTVPVVDAKGIVRGMITDRDVCMAGYTKGKVLRNLLVGETMSKPVASCHPDDSLETAMSVMKQSRVRRLPVTDGNGKLAGILSLNDLAREVCKEVKAAGRTALTTELTETLGAICEPRRSAGAAKAAAKAPGALLGV